MPLIKVERDFALVAASNALRNKCKEKLIELEKMNIKVAERTKLLSIWSISRSGSSLRCQCEKACIHFALLLQGLINFAWQCGLTCNFFCSWSWYHFFHHDSQQGFRAKQMTKAWDPLFYWKQYFANGYPYPKIVVSEGVSSKKVVRVSRHNTSDAFGITGVIPC